MRTASSCCIRARCSADTAPAQLVAKAGAATIEQAFLLYDRVASVRPPVSNKTRELHNTPRNPNYRLGYCVKI